jgi:hypothetical protein
MERANGYGQYKIVKVTPKGKKSRNHSTDSQLWDDHTEGKVSQARFKRIFNQTTTL